MMKEAIASTTQHDQKERIIFFTIHNLPRKPLSILLSFLSECDGTSMLITNKFLAYTILPLFELPLVLKVKRLEDTNNEARTTTKLSVCRHKFVPVPVEDPDILLSRLNTNRLYQRIQYFNQKKHEETTQRNKCCSYRRNMTTEELADYEHVQLGLLCRTNHANNNEQECDHHPIDVLLQNKLLPARFELLRFRKSNQEYLPFSTASTDAATDARIGLLTLLASYPRSGNSLLRSMLERVTGIVTGSDTRSDRTLSLELADVHNMVGEGITTSDKAFVVKTHFPERRGWKVIRPNRILLLTRNPFDAIDSYFHMALTNTHTKTLAHSVYDQYSTMFEEMAKSEIQTWTQFHEYWLGVVSPSSNNTKIPLPLLVVRYEDLLMKPHESMTRVIAFILGTPLSHPNDRLPPFWEKRLCHVLGPNTSTIVQTASRTSRNVDSTNMDSTASSTMALSLNDDNFYLTSWNSPQSTDRSTAIAISAAAVQHLGSYRSRSGGIIGTSISRFSSKTSLLEDMHKLAGSVLGSFGYNVLTQDFPNNIRMPKRERVLIHNKNVDTNNVKYCHPEINVNVGKELRLPDNPYGRNITAWRKNETKGDSIPMPTL